MAIIKVKKKATINTGKDVGGKEPSYTVGGNINRYNDEENY
jgi:hypothetical protein